MATRVLRASNNSTAAIKSPGSPIVGIGGSAGGFEAAMELLRHLPPRTGVAFVILQHLDPHHGTRLPNLLSKATSMPVTEITETRTPKPNAVYVQAPSKCVIARNGALTLVSRTEKLNLAIDHFLESLAEECGSRSAAKKDYAIKRRTVRSKFFRTSKMHGRADDVKSRHRRRGPRAN
ncbi:MAG: chemotaxis protein CheB [Candidatus Udaeobacter sp.]